LAFRKNRLRLTLATQKFSLNIVDLFPEARSLSADELRELKEGTGTQLWKKSPVNPE
jgi:hypothetical protein